MSSRNPTDWMWAQACDLLDEAERMHRQFFRLTASERTRAVWEPPVDVFEDEREFIVVVALPGVPAERIEVTTESGVLVVRAERAACRSPARAARCAGSRFRTAISSGASSCRKRGSRPGRAS